jgi:hypothetical protein
MTYQSLIGQLGAMDPRSVARHQLPRLELVTGQGLAVTAVAKRHRHQAAVGHDGQRIQHLNQRNVLLYAAHKAQGHNQDRQRAVMYARIQRDGAAAVGILAQQARQAMPQGQANGSETNRKRCSIASGGCTGSRSPQVTKLPNHQNPPAIRWLRPSLG